MPTVKAWQGGGRRGNVEGYKARKEKATRRG